MAEKIYRVAHVDTDGNARAEFLVKANNQPQALRAIVKHTHTVELASQADLVRLVGAGVAVLDGTLLAKDDDQELADGE